MNEKMPATVRKRFIVKGRVQKVNYRDEVQEIARALGVTGTIKNLRSGDVEVICEGEETILGKFEKALAMKKGRIDVREVVPAEPPPSKGRLEYFDIKYGPMEEELGERLGAGFGYIQEVGEKVEGVGRAVDGVGKDVQLVGQKVDSMHTDMNKRFDHMADRYDMIALSLKEAIVHMDRNAEKTDKAIERSRKESASEAIRTRKEIARSRKETVIEVRKSQKETAKILAESRKEIAASNCELARAVNFMIRKLSDKPARQKKPKKR
jgi:acylphosphatase